jgi:hypothetical protein
MLDDTNATANMLISDGLLMAWLYDTDSLQLTYSWYRCITAIMLHDTDGLHLDSEREGRVRTVSQGVRQAHQVEYRVRLIEKDSTFNRGKRD